VAALFALVVSMALPPKDVFINIDAARMVDKHTLEVSFKWASCADPKSIRAGWSGASQDKDGWDIRFSLLVLPSACSGALEKQTRQVDLRTIVRQEMTHGKIRINDESLYGHMKTLPALTVSFDLR
jgi:hypothetical protein